MLLTCEQCETQYTVPDEKIGEKGRKVRCVNCRHVWFQTLQGQEPYVEPEPEPEVSVMEDPAPEPMPEPEPEQVEQSTALEETIQPSYAGMIDIGARAFGGYLFVFLCLVTLLSLVVTKDSLVNAYPKSLVFYRAIGLDVVPPGNGFALRGMRADYKGTVLVVNGHLANMAETVLPTPKVRVRLQDQDGEPLEEIFLGDLDKTIEAGAAQAISLKLGNVPEEAKTLEITAVKD